LQGQKQEDKSVDFNDDADLLTDFFFTDADLKVGHLHSYLTWIALKIGKHDDDSRGKKAM
jgi:hypothetical protein